MKKNQCHTFASFLTEFAAPKVVLHVIVASTQPQTISSLVISCLRSGGFKQNGSVVCSTEEPEGRPWARARKWFKSISKNDDLNNKLYDLCRSPETKQKKLIEPGVWKRN
jgi:hypothetical protein